MTALKKIVLVLVGLILIFVGGFFTVGLLVPEYTYVTRVTVDAPVEKTFAVFNNPDNMSKWMSGFKSMDNISGNPNEIGSKWRLEFEEKGELMVLTETLVAFKENELYVFVLENEFMTVDVAVEFSGDGATTQITATNFVQPRGMFWKSMMRVAKGAIEKQSQQQYDTLAKLVKETP